MNPNEIPIHQNLSLDVDNQKQINSPGIIIKIVTKGTPHKLSTWNLDIAIFVHVCVTSLKIVSPNGIILSKQEVMFRVPIISV